MEDLSGVASILTAMITPAILITACGSLVLSTSQRLNRSIDRARQITYKLQDYSQSGIIPDKKELSMLYLQFKKAAKRAILLQLSMTLLYTAMGLFVATSLLLGINQIWQIIHSWVLIVVPMTGAIILLSASIVLIMETNLARLAVNEEMHFWLSSRQLDDDGK